MNEGLTADEKKDRRNSRNGISTKLGIEMYQIEPISQRPTTKSVFAFRPAGPA
jgi:hypothetical protein